MSVSALAWFEILGGLLGFVLVEFVWIAGFVVMLLAAAMAVKSLVPPLSSLAMVLFWFMVASWLFNKTFLW